MKLAGTDAGPVDTLGMREDSPSDRPDVLRVVPDAHPVLDDAFFETADSGVVLDDAFVPDAFTPEPCTTPGAVEDVTCGRCGMQSRVCTSAGTWEYGACSEPAECVDTPHDFDGDGVSYAMDCDDRDPTVVIGTTSVCGFFTCAGTPIREFVSGVRTCEGPGWSVCIPPAGCAEASCPAPGTRYTEERTCATAGCDDVLIERRYCERGVWSAWTGCSPARSRPASCDPTPMSCGACGEGVAFSVCDAACDPTASDCIGACTPGAQRRTTVGCAMGSFREVACDSMCVGGPPGPCMPYPPEVDVMLLVDTTSSHYPIVRANAARLATELVGGLLADADVRVGVATVADFPRLTYGDYGRDEPFRAVLAPTRDMAQITTALTSLSEDLGRDSHEGGVEALHVLAGGTPHPDSVPFVCAADLVAGGCWRASAQRAVVLITHATHHNIPEVTGAGPLDPYVGFTPLPPTWTTARAQLVSGRVAFFAIVENTRRRGPDGVGQMRFIATELVQDPDGSVVVYPADMRDLTTASRSMVANLRSYLGLTP